MTTLLCLILLAAVYVGVGYFRCKGVAKKNGEVFKLDWKQLLTWPKDLF